MVGVLEGDRGEVYLGELLRGSINSIVWLKGDFVYREELTLPKRLVANMTVDDLEVIEVGLTS